MDKLQRMRPIPANWALIASALLAGLLLSGCEPEVIEAVADPEIAPAYPAASLLPAGEADAATCVDGGALRTTLFGALSGEIEWTLDQLSCQGMPRPDAAGARLRFSGTVGEDQRGLAFIIAIPNLEEGSNGIELPSNVTVIEESSSRFFSSPDMETCWTDVEDQWLLDEESDDERYRIEGVLYCIAPLGEINGIGSVSIPELQFSGLLDWNAK